ncbi:uncharacterized protein si:ch211-217g15.3 [Gambusia affinis]|uniref:uncharacterized protein si:ch211-217g15.3 n=1 Tax=Gambusia affinis TaxID=33528 RepID=UPI001CDD2E7C|nr:uncharacterized protein si:ch211-217g15.3 [Gambusia affinis]
MIRVSVIVSVLLMLSINAKPLNKPSDEHLEQRVVLIDDKGKLSWGTEVEPPEDMDRIEYELDPRMRIWNSMKANGQEKHYLKPEEDLDKIYHPSTVELQAQIREFGYEAEKKEDGQHSPAQMEQVVYLQPEEDMDDVYHKELFLPALQRDVPEAAAPVDIPSQRKYTEPEEDLDYLYHKRFDMPVLQQKVAETPVHIPSQRKYTKPEEDLDGLYHH